MKIMNLFLIAFLILVAIVMYSIVIIDIDLFIWSAGIAELLCFAFMFFPGNMKRHKLW